MLSYLQFDQNHVGKIYCKLTKNRQLIAKLAKLIHCPLIFELFIHRLYSVLRIFYLMILSSSVYFLVPTKIQLKWQLKA